MNELFQASVSRMNAAGVVFVLPDDFDDLAELHRLAGLVTGGERTTGYEAAIDPELHIGGVVLRRPSLGAVEFIDGPLREWFADDPDAYHRGLFYVLAHADRPDVLFATRSRTLWSIRARLWCRRVSASMQTIRAALDAFQRREKDAQPAARKSDYGWMIETLVSDYGETPHHWIWNVDLSTIAMLLQHRAARKEAERKAAGLAVASDPDSPSIRALYAFREFETALRERKLKGAAP